MLTDRQEVNSQARVRILSDINTWTGFNTYFTQDWQRQEMRLRLVRADVDLWFVGEWAIWSFHELAKEEGTWKRERGEEFKRAQRTIIDSCEQAARNYRTYSGLLEDAPEITRVNAEFAELLKKSETLAERARTLLEIAENSAIFESKRLGANWNGLYLALLKYYISTKTGWDETEVMSAITHLVAAALENFRRPQVATPLRRLLQKAIRHFEGNPKNSSILMRVKDVVTNPESLLANFPRVRLRAPR
jgi:hypothetical protein